MKNKILYLIFLSAVTLSPPSHSVEIGGHTKKLAANSDKTAPNSAIAGPQNAVPLGRSVRFSGYEVGSDFSTHKIATF